METYASFLVYLWAIYDNLSKAIVLVMMIGLFYPVIIFLLNGLSQSEVLPVKYSKYAIIVFFVSGTLVTLLPKKEYLPYIIAASPVASAVTSSYQYGKLKKIDDLINLSLDKAINSITNPNPKENK